LAFKGAELILFPSEGYSRPMMLGRAADNGVWLAASSMNTSAAVWDPGGGCWTRDNKDKVKVPQEWDPTGGDLLWGPSIVDSQIDGPWLVVKVDLNQRRSPAWYGRFGSAPGGRKVRDTRRVAIYNELAAAAMK